MAETTLPPTPRSRLPLTFLETIWQNPVVLKELRSRMRGGRAFILISIYLFVLAGMVGLIYLGFLASEATGTTGNAGARQALGKSVFGVVVSMELMMVAFIAPALTASSISGEREHQTYDLLRTTLLSARSLVAGKMFSALSFILLLLFSAFPLQSMAYLFGGVALSEIVIATLVLVVTAVAFCALGLFFSSFLRRTLVSTVLAYATSILIIFGIPMIVLTALLMMQTFLYGLSNRASEIAEFLFVVVGWLIISINPLATAIATEVILIDQQNLFYTTMTLPFSSSTNIYLPSPWILYCIFYLLASLVLTFLSVLFVRRVER